MEQTANQKLLWGNCNLAETFDRTGRRNWVDKTKFRRQLFEHSIFLPLRWGKWWMDKTLRKKSPFTSKCFTCLLFSLCPIKSCSNWENRYSLEGRPKNSSSDRVTQFLCLFHGHESLNTLFELQCLVDAPYCGASFLPTEVWRNSPTSTLKFNICMSLSLKWSFTRWMNNIASFNCSLSLIKPWCSS